MLRESFINLPIFGLNQIYSDKFYKIDRRAGQVPPFLRRCKNLKTEKLGEVSSDYFAAPYLNENEPLKQILDISDSLGVLTEKKLKLYDTETKLLKEETDFVNFDVLSKLVHNFNQGLVSVCVVPATTTDYFIFYQTLDKNIGFMKFKRFDKLENAKFVSIDSPLGSIPNFTNFISIPYNLVQYVVCFVGRHIRVYNPLLVDPLVADINTNIDISSVNGFAVDVNINNLQIFFKQGADYYYIEVDQGFNLVQNSTSIQNPEADVTNPDPFEKTQSLIFTH